MTQKPGSNHAFGPLHCPAGSEFSRRQREKLKGLRGPDAPLLCRAGLEFSARQRDKLKSLRQSAQLA